jgi:hypothetical protein
MRKKRCTVVLSYDPQDLEVRQKVVTCITRLDPDAAGLIKKNASKGRLILKRNTDPETARRLKQLFAATGATCDIQDLSAKPSAEGANDPKTVDSPSLVQCPKCGCEQPEVMECQACGVILSKAKPHNPFLVAENPDPPPSHRPAPQRIQIRLRQWAQPMLSLVKKIEHPIDVRKLTTWSKRVADRLIRCGLVFSIALMLEIGLLALGKMLWSIYVATPIGQYYVTRLPEQAQVFQRILEADPLALGLDVTLVVFCAGLLVGCVAQILHLIRYLYDSQGILGKLILWFIPCTGLTAWAISGRYPYPDPVLAGTMTIIPTLCMLSSCLYLTRILLPELGDLRAVVSIVMGNRGTAWALIIKKIRIWFDKSKRVY